jgi:membrane-associated phospholipid phosphatase
MYTAAHLPLDVVGGTGLGIVTGAAALLIFGVPRRP